MAASVADAMFALSAPSRVRILSLLRERPHTVGELMAAIDMEQSAVSHQLRVLRDHRLVIAERDGRQRVYALHDEHVAALLDEAIGHVAHLSRARGGKRASTRGLRRAG
ncbi:MAG TPA: metalloregulator ArsR/SmtB family transcription factor [Solirubrobacteraceae bacterium]|jgi:DNA-binding transcriptional ArsR family regulator